MFFCERVKYLGHVISVQGVEADPSKVEAIVQWPRPGTVSKLQTFLGFVSYYRRFVEGFSSRRLLLKSVTMLLRQ